MGHDVFISHSSKDKAAADAVCAALESNGVRCWVAPRDIKPGENWATSILRGIAECRMRVLVVRGLLGVLGEMAAAAPPALSVAPARAAGRVSNRRRPLLFAAVLISLLAALSAAWAWRSDLRRFISGTPEQAPSSQRATAGFTNTIGMKFTRIEPGEFLMGSPSIEGGRVPDREVQHKVKLTKPFLLGIHHVTRGQFAAFVKDAAYRTDAQKDGWAYCLSADGTKDESVAGASWEKPGFDQTDDHPVVEVSWNDAQAFCRWLAKKEGKKYRLPTEAEYEYACRAGTHTAYFWGDDPDGGQGFANCADLTAKDKFPHWTTFNWRDGFVLTSPVGSFKPNHWGLYDMTGNVFQWCSDYYGPYGDADAIDPSGPVQGDAVSSRVQRGGSWDSDAPACRAASRFGNPPDFRIDYVGFRVCLDF